MMSCPLRTRDGNPSAPKKTAPKQAACHTRPSLGTVKANPKTPASTKADPATVKLKPGTGGTASAERYQVRVSVLMVSLGVGVLPSISCSIEKPSLSWMLPLCAIAIPFLQDLK